MRLILLYSDGQKSSTFLIKISDSDCSLENVKKIIAENTLAPLNELHFFLDSVKIEINELLKIKDGAEIRCRRKAINPPISIVSAPAYVPNVKQNINALDGVPNDILSVILGYLPFPIEKLITLSRVNKSLNRIKASIFPLLQNQQIRNQVNREISDLNIHSRNKGSTEYVMCKLDFIDKQKITALFKNKTHLPVKEISAFKNSKNKKIYRIATVDYCGNAENEKNAKKFMDVLSKKGRSDLVKKHEGYMLGSATHASLSFFLPENDPSILNDSTILKNKPALESSGVRTALGTAASCLLEQKSKEVPFIEFVTETLQDGSQNIKLVLRYRDHHFARELFYALQKEGYNGRNEVINRTDSALNEFDVYPCEYIDRETKIIHQFVATSSVEINGVDNILRFIFSTCGLGAQYAPGLICKDKMGNEPILKLEERNLVVSFSKCLQKIIQFKMAEYENGLQNPRLYSPNSPTLKWKYLNSNLKTLDSARTFKDLYHIFSDVKTLELGGGVLEIYRHFRDIFSILCASNQNEIKEKPSMQ